MQVAHWNSDDSHNCPFILGVTPPADGNGEQTWVCVCEHLLFYMLADEWFWPLWNMLTILGSNVAISLSGRESHPAPHWSWRSLQASPSTAGRETESLPHLRDPVLGYLSSCLLSSMGRPAEPQGTPLGLTESTQAWNHIRCLPEAHWGIDIVSAFVNSSYPELVHKPSIWFISFDSCSQFPVPAYEGTKRQKHCKLNLPFYTPVRSDLGGFELECYKSKRSEVN